MEHSRHSDELIAHVAGRHMARLAREEAEALVRGNCPPAEVELAALAVRERVLRRHPALRDAGLELEARCHRAMLAHRDAVNDELAGALSEQYARHHLALGARPGEVIRELRELGDDDTWATRVVCRQLLYKR